MGAKIIVIFVTISIVGTLNGLIMASIRQAYSLAIRGMLPKSETIAKINKRINIPLYSGVTALVFTLLWFAVHFILLKSKVSGFDISEISITLNYVLFGFIYARVLQCGIKKKINGVFKGVICPLFAIAGSVVILIGGMGSELFWADTVICLVILLSAAVFWKRKVLS